MARPRLVGQEVERVLVVTLLIVEHGAVLHLEAVGGDRREHAHALEDGQGRRQKRLADVEAREGLALEQEDAAARAGEKRGGGGARGPAADHDDVVLVGRHRRAHRRGLTGSATGSTRPGSPSSRSCEQSQRTSGETKSGDVRGANVCAIKSVRITGAAAVAGAATSARRGRGSCRHRATRFSTCWIASW